MQGNIRLLGWHNFLTDFRLYGPFIVIYFAEVSGSWTLAMAVMSIQMVVSAALEIPTGILSDRMGRKKTLAAGSVFSAAAVATYSIAPSFALLALGGLFEGVARSLFTGNNTALLYDTAKAEGKEGEYHHLLGRTSMMFQLAMSISAVLGGLLAFGSLRLIVALSVIPQVLAIFASLRIKEPEVHKSISENSLEHFKEAFRHLKGHSRLKWLTLAQSLGYGFGEANYTFVSVYFKTLWPLWAIGFLRGAGNGLAAASFWMSGRTIDRFGHFPILIFARFYSFIANALALALNSLVSPALIASTSIFFGTITVANDHLVQKTFTDDQRATLGSLVSFLGSLVYVPASLFIGAIADAAGPRVAILISVSILLVITPIYVMLFRSDRKSRPPV